ncbi:MAG: hypothetical protein KBF97_08445, partial [Bacteroidetes bacterium]|nr:hypothetical protein [Bacteroidota bacterium]
MKKRNLFLLLIGMSLSIPLQWLFPQLSNNPAAAGVLGQTDYITKTTGNGTMKLNGPNGIAVDPTTGKVFVVDRGNHRVLRWSSADALVSGSAAEAVLGQPDFTTITSGVTASKFNTPINCTVDNAGRLWV